MFGGLTEQKGVREREMVSAGSVLIICCEVSWPNGTYHLTCERKENKPVFNPDFVVQPLISLLPLSSRRVGGFGLGS